MRHVLDTNAFYHPGALAHLASLPDDVVVPAIVLAERARQLQRDAGIPAQEFLRLLHDNHFVVEPLGASEACACAPLLDDGMWRWLARDSLIAGHVRPGDTLWTQDRQGFESLGIAPGSIADPAQW